MKTILTDQELAIKAKTGDISLFENILKSSTEISIIATDIDLDIIFFSKKAAEIFGYQVSDIIGKNLREIDAIQNVNFKRVEDVIKIVRKTNSYEYWIKTENKYLKSNVRGIWNYKKELIGFVLFTNDVTEQINSRKELQKLSTVAEQSPVSIVITDVNGNIEYVNSKFTEISGYTAKEVIGKNPRILNSGKLPKEYYSQLWKTITEGKTWKGEFLNKAKNGNLFWEQVNITPIKDEENKVINFIAIKQDITEFKKNEERFQTLLNAVPDIICYKDGKGRWLLANDANLKLFCLANVDYFGKTDAELAKYTYPIYQDSFLKCMDSDEIAWKNKTISHGIEVISTVAGKDKTYDVYKIPTFYSDGKRKGLTIIGREITELKKTEKALIKAKEKAEESNQLKTEFIRNISHEIRTPMNAILGFSSLLDEKDLTEEKQKDYISIIQNSGNQLLNILDGILEISRLETKQVKVIEKQVCLNDLLLELFLVFDIKAKEKGIPLYLKTELRDKESTIRTDETKLNKILANLLENALKFTTQGFIEFGYHLKNNKIEIYVKDTGIGIKLENQEIIFKRFSKEEKSLSQNVGGLGLGLSIAKENAKLFGGIITLQSEKGKGSTFFLSIPYKPVISGCLL